MLIINSTDGWSEWFGDELKVMKMVMLVGSGGGYVKKSDETWVSIDG